MKFIVGLGNPGKEYDMTRHNAGFEALDALAASHHLSWSNDMTHHAMVAKLSVDGISMILAKPTTYMNESGTTVVSLLSYYKVAPEDVLVVQDEMDLPPGKMAFLASGGAAGHNGIADIQEKTGRNDIARLRIGVGRPTGHITKENWVLEKATGEDADAIKGAIKKASEAAQDWATIGIVKAMNKWH